MPFVDLGRVNGVVAEDVLADIADLFDDGSFTNGPQVATFERAYAAYCGSALCVGAASGLDALRFALLGAGVDRGDEVVVPAHTFVATYEAVEQVGGVPVVVDVTEADYNLDVAAAEGAITSRTKVVVPVHLYGQMADAQAIATFAAKHDLLVVEDACQAHGAARAGIRAGAAGHAAAFSFYPTKNLGAAGDAGALVTSDRRIAETARALREHGQTSKYRHVVSGYSARLDTVQAIVLLHKLPYLDGWNEERRLAAAYYREELRDVGDLRLPPVPAGSEPVWHLYAVRTGDPAALGEWLAESGIASGRHYPEPPHLTAAHSALGHRRGAFPVAEALARELLSLPIFPGITEEQLAAVVGGVRAFFDRG